MFARAEAARDPEAEGLEAVVGRSVLSGLFFFRCRSLSDAVSLADAEPAAFSISTSFEPPALDFILSLDLPSLADATLSAGLALFAGATALSVGMSSSILSSSIRGGDLRFSPMTFCFLVFADCPPLG